MAAMSTPPRTKSCTFPACDGRMVLTHDEAAAERSIVSDEPHAVWGFWECEEDPSHIERARVDNAQHLPEETGGT